MFDNKMKVNLFNGIIVFEGTIKQLKGFLDLMPEVKDKIIGFQHATNMAVFEHQKMSAEAQAEIGNNQKDKGPAPRGPGNF